MDLENLVTELGHKCVAVASSKDEAVAKAHSERPAWCWPTSIWVKADRALMR